MPLPGVGILLENPSASPIPFPVAWGTTNLGLSTFSGVTPFYPQPPYGTAVDTPDCYFQLPNLVTMTLAANYVIPPGLGYISTPTTASMVTSLQLFVAGSSGGAGVWTTIYSTVAATLGYMFYVSDGVNVRLLNSGAAGIVTIYPIRA